MRYSAIIHLIIVFFAVQALYSGSLFCAGNLFGLIALVIENDSSWSMMSGAPLYFVSGFLTLLLGWLLLKKSIPLTEFIATKSGFQSQLKVRGNGKQLLSIFIIFLAISTLLTAIPPFLRNIFYAFKQTASGTSLFEEAPKTADWFITIIDIILPCLLIVFCRPLTNYFSKNIVMDGDIAILEDIVDEQEEDDDEDFEESDEHEEDGDEDL